MHPGVLQLWMMGEGPLQYLYSDPRGSRLIFSMIYAGRTFPRGLGWLGDVTSRLHWAALGFFFLRIVLTRQV